ncbi:hypothetical protein LCE31_39415, partial [Streptomyces sp. 8L]|nr:hypothetical protein [Streptomyces sp. 8L]
MQSAPTTDTHAELPRTRGPQDPHGYDRAQDAPGTQEPQGPQGPAAHDAARAPHAEHGAPAAALPQEEPAPGGPVSPGGPHGDPRLGWSSTEPNRPPHP